MEIKKLEIEEKPVCMNCGDTARLYQIIDSYGSFYVCKIGMDALKVQLELFLNDGK